MRLAVTTFLVSAVGCATARLVEPPMEHQLWSERACFAHMLPEWRHEVLRKLSGKVYAAHDGAEGAGLPDAEVLFRPWPQGATQRVTTGAEGTFVVPGASSGVFEVAICLPGWNPWRGIVQVSSKANRSNGAFPLELGQ